MVSLFGGSLVFLTWNQVDLTKYFKTAPQVPSSLNRNWVHCGMISVLDFFSLFSEKLASISKMSVERAALLLKSWPYWCIILVFFFLGLIWTHCHLKSNQISQFQVIRIFFDIWSLWFIPGWQEEHWTKLHQRTQNAKKILIKDQVRKKGPF